MLGFGRPSVAAVVVYLLCDVIGSTLGQRCDDFGCCYSNRYTRLVCSFSKPKINFNLKGLRDLAEAWITEGRSVDIRSDAVARTPKLRSLTISSVRELAFSTNNEVQVEPQREIEVMVKQVGHLILKSSAFFGWQSELATLAISDTEKVQIEGNAFPSESTFQRIRFSNISSLSLDTEAIGSKIGSLELVNISSLRLHRGSIQGTIVTLDMRHIGRTWWCPPQAIGGSIGLVSLHSVAIQTAESRCLDAGSGWDSLTITDSRLGHLSPRSVYGTINNISISDCQVVRAGPVAFDVFVARLSLSNVTVDEMGPSALLVRATVSAALRAVSVYRLRPGALSGLQLASTTGAVRGVTVSGLRVQHSEPGSLQFAAGTPVTVTDLQLADSCSCSSPSWASQLLLEPSAGAVEDSFGGGEYNLSRDNNSFLSDDKYFFSDGDVGISGDGGAVPPGDGPTEDHEALLRQIEAGLCTVGNASLSLANFTAQHCGDPADAGGSSGQRTNRSAPLAGWWAYLGVVALAALLLAMAALLATVGIRYCRHRRLTRRIDKPEQLQLAAVVGKGEPCSSGSRAAGSDRCPAPVPCEETEREPEAVYSEVAEHHFEGHHRTDESRAVGASTRPQGAGGCSCPPTDLYAVSTQLERSCGCGYVLPTSAEPQYANLPGSGTGTEPTPEGTYESVTARGQLAHPGTELATGRATRELVDPVDHGTAQTCTEDLPDYAEIVLETPAYTTATQPTDHMINNSLYGSNA